MGKDDKQRRKGQSASSSRAAELLQASGLGIQFLNLGGNDPSSLEFPTRIDEGKADEYADVDPEIRIVFRKFNKREANTREKGLVNLSELIQKADVNSPNIANGIRHFVKFYNYLVFDSVSTVRSSANDTLAVSILKFRKKIAEHIVKMIPSTLISKFDPHPGVRRSVVELLNKCFNEDQRRKIYESATSKSIKMCLAFLQKKHSLVNKQKYDDAETSEQRSERIIIQSFAAVGELSMNCPGMTEEILNTINNVYDSTMEMGLNVRNAMLLCILQLIKNGQDVFNKNQSDCAEPRNTVLQVFMLTDASFKVMKLLDLEEDSLCKNAFGIYLYMAEAVAASTIETLFSGKDFINELVLRMITKKGRHFYALQESLLPLMIIAIKYKTDSNPCVWVLNCLDAFFEGDVSDDLYLAWASAYVDVSNWLYKSFLPTQTNEDFEKKLNLSSLNFVQAYLERKTTLSPDVGFTPRNMLANFISRRMRTESAKQDKLGEDLSSLLIGDLPDSASLIESMLPPVNDINRPQGEMNRFNILTAKVMVDSRTPEPLFRRLLLLKAYVNNQHLDSNSLIKKLFTVFKEDNVDDEFFECYKYLQENGLSGQHKLNEIIDIAGPTNISRVIRVFSQNAKSFSSKERQSILQAYILSSDLTTGNPWTDDFLCWVEELDAESVFSLAVESQESLSLRLYAKLLLVLASLKISFTEEQKEELANSILKSIFTFTQNVDRGDLEDLNRFLENSSALKPFVDSIFSQLESTKSCDLSSWVCEIQNY